MDPDYKAESPGEKAKAPTVKEMEASPPSSAPHDDVETITAGAEAHQEDLAKQGSHQLLIAHKHMNDNRYDLAVPCLIQESKLGSEEATELLRTCMEQNKGITEANFSTIEWCISTSANDKLAVDAMRSVYRSINTTGEPLDRASFIVRVRASEYAASEKKMIEKAAKVTSGVDLITEEIFIERMMQKLSDGSNLGFFLNMELGQEVKETTTQVKSLLKTPASALSSVGEHTVNIAAKQGMHWLRSMIPTHQIHLLIVISIYSLISVHLLLKALPLLVFYISFVGMILTTFRMYYNQCKLKGLHTLTAMLQTYHDQLNTQRYIQTFTQKTITSYVVFFPCAFCAIISYSMADVQWIPSGEFVYIAMFFAGFALFTICLTPRVFQYIGAGLRGVSLLPALAQNFPRIPVLYALVQLIVGTPLQFNVAPDAWLSFGLPTLAHLALPIIYVKLASHHNWQGLLESLLPQLVLAMWLEVVVLFFKSATLSSLFSGFVSCLLLALLLPVYGIGLIIWLGFCVLEMISFAGLLRIVIAFVAIALPAALAIWAKSGFKFKGTDINSNTGRVILVLLSAFSVLPMIYFITPPERGVGEHYLTWKSYREYCSEPEWNRTSIAHAQTQCSHFQGTMVNWQGTIKKITVNSIDNQADTIISYLPWTVANWLKCSFGKEYPPCSELKDPMKQELCRLRTMQGATCHLRNMDHYLFEIWMKMPIREDVVHDVRITAHHKFRNSLSPLREGHTIRVRASLQSDLGNVWPVMKLYHIECVDCLIDLISASSELQDEELLITVMRLLRKALFNVLNVFTAPFVQFGSE